MFPSIVNAAFFPGGGRPILFFHPGLKNKKGRPIPEK